LLILRYHRARVPSVYTVITQLQVDKHCIQSAYLSVCLSVCMLAYLRNYIISRLYQIVNDLALDVQFAWADSCSVVLVVA